MKFIVTHLELVEMSSAMPLTRSRRSGGGAFRNGYNKGCCVFLKAAEDAKGPESSTRVILLSGSSQLNNKRHFLQGIKLLRLKELLTDEPGK